MDRLTVALIVLCIAVTPTSSATSTELRLVGDIQLSNFLDVLDFSTSGERFSARLKVTEPQYPQQGGPEEVSAWEAAVKEAREHPEWLAVYPTPSGLVAKEFQGLYGSWHANDVLYYVDLPGPLALCPIVGAPDVLDVRPIGLSELLRPAVEAVARAAWVYAETWTAPAVDLGAFGGETVDTIAEFSKATTTSVGDYTPGPEPALTATLRHLAAAANVYFTTESGRDLYPGKYGFTPTQGAIFARLPSRPGMEPISVPGFEGASSLAYDSTMGRALIESYDHKSFATYRIGVGPEATFTTFDENSLDEFEYRLLPGRDLLIATRSSLVDCPPPTSGPYVELRDLGGNVLASLSTDCLDAESRPRLYDVYSSNSLIVLWIGRVVDGDWKHLLRVYHVS